MPARKYLKVSNSQPSTAATSTLARCVRTDIRCWGSNEYRQASPPDETLVSISGGTIHTCGLSQDGSAVCWGNDEAGQASPPSGETFVSITAGSFHTCGLRENGSHICWGAVELDAAASQSLPGEDERFVQISSGGLQTCGLREDGTHVCWQYKPAGEISESVGERGLIDRTISAITTGRRFTRLDVDGVPLCWLPPEDAVLVSISSGVFQPAD